MHESKELMSYCEYNGLQGKFFPIAFFITIHETGADISFFIRHLKRLLKY